MKKIAIGCGIVLVVVAIAVGVGSWYAIHKVKETFAGFADLAKVPDIEKGVTNSTPYSPPDSGELTQAQVTRFLAVQDHVKQTLGTRYKELDAKYKALSERINKKQDTALDFPEVVAAYRDLASMYVEAKRAQVDALNQNSFSLSEYKWVRKQAYLADRDAGDGFRRVRGDRRREERQEHGHGQAGAGDTADGAERPGEEQAARRAPQEGARGQRPAQLLRTLEEVHGSWVHGSMGSALPYAPMDLWTYEPMDFHVSPSHSQSSSTVACAVVPPKSSTLRRPAS